MTCGDFKNLLPDLLFDDGACPPATIAEAERHATECASCGQEWREMRATMELLEEWKDPEPSSYFDARLSARLREEARSPAPGWMERLRTRLHFGNAFHLRPAMAAAVAVLFVAAGAGSYVGFESLQSAMSPHPAVSATVQDLEFLDANAQTLDQLAAFDDSGALPTAVSGSVGGGAH